MDSEDICASGTLIYTIEYKRKGEQKDQRKEGPKERTR
jgi:hypothetical protein